MADEQKISVYSNFLGWGSIKDAKIVFLGYEPGMPAPTKSHKSVQQELEDTFQVYISTQDGLLPWTAWHEEWGLTQEKFENEFKKQIMDNWLPHRATEIWQVWFSLLALKRIFGLVVDDTWNKVNILRYDAYEFCRVHEVAVNLFPLAKRSKASDYPPETKVFLGFDKAAHREEIKNAIWAAGRLDHLRNLLNEKLHGRVITICMGGFSVKEENELKTRVFLGNKFSDLSSPYLKRGQRISISQSGEVVFTPHPTHGG